MTVTLLLVIILFSSCSTLSQNEVTENETIEIEIIEEIYDYQKIDEITGISKNIDIELRENKIENIVIISPNVPIFPRMLFFDAVRQLKRNEKQRTYGAITAEEFEEEKQNARYQISMLMNNDILTYYGHPRSRNMGILGRYTIEGLDQQLTKLAAEYDEANGDRNIIKAFYLIYGTVWPEGLIGIISDQYLLPYIEYALENNILIFVDHQIGKYDPIESLQSMFKYLHYPNVHLALDPEWRTNSPGLEIGHLTGKEINQAQQVMEEYLIENDLPGERMLVIHQFNHIMIKNREDIRSDFHRVRLVHCADGFGSPGSKRTSYAFNARAENIPIKGFKLFYNFEIPGAGYDNPLMTPKEVFELKPRPYVIMYQ